MSIHKLSPGAQKLDFEKSPERISAVEQIKSIGLESLAKGLEQAELASDQLPPIFQLQPSEAAVEKVTSWAELFKDFTQEEIRGLRHIDFNLCSHILRGLAVNPSHFFFADLLDIKILRVLRDFFDSVLPMPQKDEGYLKWEEDKITSVITCQFLAQLKLRRQLASARVDEAICKEELQTHKEEITRFIAHLNEVARRYVQGQHSEGTAKYRMLLKGLQVKIAHLDELFGFYFKCEPNLVLKVLFKAFPQGLYSLDVRKEKRPLDQLAASKDLIDFAQISYLRISCLQQRFGFSKEFFIPVAVFLKKIQALPAQKATDAWRTDLQKAQDYLGAQHEKYLRQLIAFDRRERRGQLDPTDPLREHSLVALTELVRFCDTAINLLLDLLENEKIFEEKSRLTRRAVGVCQALDLNMRSMMAQLYGEGFLIFENPLDAHLSLSFVHLKHSCFSQILKEIEKEIHDNPLRVFSLRLHLLFQDLYEEAKKALETAMPSAQLWVKPREYGFDRHAGEAGWLCSLLILKHDLACLLQDAPITSLEEILEPVLALYQDLIEEDEGSDAQKCEQEELSFEESEIESSFCEPCSQEPTEHLAAALAVSEKPVEELDSQSMHLERKQKRLEHLELMLARKAKGRKFLQAVSEICGVDVAFLKRKGKGSHKTVEMGAQAQSIKLTYAAHNPGDQQKLGTRDGFLKTAKAFADQVKKS